MKAFIISLFLHIILILLICFTIKNSHVQKNQATGLITPEAYIVSQPILITPKIQHKQFLQHTTNEKTVPKAKGLIATSHQSSSSSMQQQPLSGKSSAIVILLHNKIQQQLSLYQDEIPQVSQQNIELTLTAYPDGSLQNIKIISPHNSDEVSAAVLSILKNMSLIIELQNTLIQAESFQLTVEIK